MRWSDLPRWPSVIVMIVAVAAVGAIAAVSPMPTAADGDPRPAAVASSAPGWHGTDVVMPVSPRIKAAYAYERALRVKHLSLVGVVAVASLTAMPARGTGLRRRPRRSRLLLAWRARSLSRRAPPALPVV